ncbi:MAG: ATP-dependent 6-phosphofructokinase [Victivallaceae bacterium]|nr:ATP-dependent 6-phosphofructokinase [Victivallaceae bacterium]
MESKDFKITRLGTPRIKSPLRRQDFVADGATVAYDTDAKVLTKYVTDNQEIPAFELAGPREKIFHDPAWSKAAILTAGGICPGLNDVIKFLTSTLIRHYKVPVVYGIPYGYRGLDPAYGLSPIMLTEEMTDDIHEQGGTILGSSRGGVDSEIIVDTLDRMGINLLFCIGGDGTSRGAHDISIAAAKRHLAISVICVPKTIDNDIAFIDKSFGFESAVSQAGFFITGAHAEAKGAYNGIGLVKVMGRDSGFIAAYSTLANSFVNYCLVPEVPFTLEGDGDRALLPNLEQRMAKKHHAVIMVAEGAGQDLFETGGDEVRDASGNRLHKDIGLLLKDRINQYFKKRNIEINVKYFDLSYTIRSVTAHGADAVFCAMLAQNAVHAAMAGRTDMVIGHWGDNFTHVPIALATGQRKKIELTSPLWSSVKSTTCF